MDVVPMEDGGSRTKPELTLEQTREWDTKKQQQIIEALMSTEPVNKDAQFDVEVVEEKLEDEWGDERPSTGYIYFVKGKYTRVVPQNSELSWEPPFVLVQVVEDEGHAPQRRHILSEIAEFSDVDNNGVVDIKRLGTVVMGNADLDRRPNSNIWQTLGRFAAVVPEDKSWYQIDSAVAPESNDREEMVRDADSKPTGALGPESGSVDASSYHMGYADGYRAALQEQND